MIEYAIVTRRPKNMTWKPREDSLYEEVIQWGNHVSTDFGYIRDILQYLENNFRETLKLIAEQEDRSNMASNMATRAYEIDQATTYYLIKREVTEWERVDLDAHV